MKSKSVYCLCIAFGVGLSACKNQKTSMILNVDLTSHEAEVPSSMYGIFFEEINHAGDGGLYGELLMNRSFEERVLLDGYTVKDGRLVPPPVIHHITKESTDRTFNGELTRILVGSC